jgi:hypothetical protein
MFASRNKVTTRGRRKRNRPVKCAEGQVNNNSDFLKQTKRRRDIYEYAPAKIKKSINFAPQQSLNMESYKNPVILRGDNQCTQEYLHAVTCSYSRSEINNMSTRRQKGALGEPPLQCAGCWMCIALIS